MNAAGTRSRAIAKLRTVMDPELPMLNIVELGLLREVEVEEDGLHITLTPTYSGCPAIETIVAETRRVLADLGPVSLRIAHAPPWTTDWITEDARRKLRAAGIAPPAGRVAQPEAVRCPRCDATASEQVSAFGSTACKSLWRCANCDEPFELLKLI